jgi:hypothetical protein
MGGWGDEGVPKVWNSANVVVRVVGQSFCCHCFSSVVAAVVGVVLLPGSRGDWLRRSHLCAPLSDHRKYPTDPTRLASVGDIKVLVVPFFEGGVQGGASRRCAWGSRGGGLRRRGGVRSEPPSNRHARIFDWGVVLGSGAELVSMGFVALVVAAVVGSFVEQEVGPCA